MDGVQFIVFRRHRYRGYYFDSDTGWYYLQTRYYDPLTRRFVSPDSPSAAVVQSGAFGGLNPYSYCLNDPVSHSDPTGRWAEWILYALIGLFLGIAVDQAIRSVQTFIREPSWLNLGLAVLGLANVVVSIFSAVKLVQTVNALARSSNLLRVYDNAQANFTKMPKSVRGLDAHNVVQYERLKANYAAQEISNANRTGTALIKTDPTHRSASFLSIKQMATGRVNVIRGYDGISRSLLQVKGGLNGTKGIFEYILEPNGMVSHQRFIQNGIFTGFPNQ